MDLTSKYHLQKRVEWRISNQLLVHGFKYPKEKELASKHFQPINMCLSSVVDE